jgi:glucose/arabinose dehydrogenase
MREAGLLVGNLLFGPTDGILRYDGRGHFIDNMVPPFGDLVTCCMAFGPDENLYVSSPDGSAVLRFNGVTGALIDTFVPPGSGGLAVPLVLLFHEGYLYVGDTGAGAVRRYDASTGAYVDDFIPDNSQGMGGNPGDLQHFAFGPDRNLYVAAQITRRVLRFDGETGAFMDEFVPSSEGFSPSGLTFGPDGLMYVGSPPGNEVRRYDVWAGSGETFIAPGGRLSRPVGIVFGPDGNFYAANLGTAEILRYDVAGRFLGALVPSGRGGVTGPRMIAWKAKTMVCHLTEAAHAKTLTVGYLSARDHLQHGDTLGSCQ